MTRNTHARNRAERLERARPLCEADGKVCRPELATALLEAVVEAGDRLVIEGDNQKQADLLARALAGVDPARVHDLHMVQSVLALPEHLAVFERGIAGRLDFAFAGPQSRKLTSLVGAGRIRLGAIHTYLELYVRTDAGGPRPARRLGRGGQGGPAREPVHRPQHRRHADRGRSGRVPGRRGASTNLPPLPPRRIDAVSPFEVSSREISPRLRPWCRGALDRGNGRGRSAARSGGIGPTEAGETEMDTAGGFGAARSLAAPTARRTPLCRRRGGFIVTPERAFQRTGRSSPDAPRPMPARTKRHSTRSRSRSAWARAG